MTAVEPTRKGEALANAVSMMVAGGHVGPLGLVISVPIGLGAAVFALAGQEEHCVPQSRSVLGDLPQWTLSTFGSTPVVTNVADAARRQVRGVGGPAVLASDAGASPEARAREVTAVGIRLGVDTVIVADVYVMFGEAAGCTTQLAARADVRVQPLERPEMTSPRFSLWAEQADVPLEEWAKNPQRAREELSLLLEQLGGKLIESYRIRMNCSEATCDW